jgi:hypothetical protein
VNKRINSYKKIIKIKQYGTQNLSKKMKHKNPRGLALIPDLQDSRYTVGHL